MDTLTLNKVILTTLACNEKSNIDKKYTGVFPIDHISQAELFVPGELRVCVLNSQTSSQVGEHWFIVGVDLRHEPFHAFVFDSLAKNLKTNYLSVYNFLKDNIMQPLEFILSNRTKFQSDNLDSCSLHVVYFLILILNRNLSFENALQTFYPDDTLLNDCALLEKFNDFFSCHSEHALLTRINDQLTSTVDECTDST
jgi:hypothetical protein